MNGSWDANGAPVDFKPMAYPVIDPRFNVVPPSAAQLDHLRAMIAEAAGRRWVSTATGRRLEVIDGGKS